MVFTTGEYYQMFKELFNTNSIQSLFQKTNITLIPKLYKDNKKEKITDQALS